MFSGLSLALKKKQLAVKLTVIRYTPLVEVNQASVNLVTLYLLLEILPYLRNRIYRKLEEDLSAYFVNF